MTMWGAVKTKCAVPDCPTPDKEFYNLRIAWYHLQVIHNAAPYRLFKNALIVVDDGGRRTMGGAYTTWAREQKGSLALGLSGPTPECVVGDHDDCPADWKDNVTCGCPHHLASLIRGAFIAGWKARTPRRRNP